MAVLALVVVAGALVLALVARSELWGPFAPSPQDDNPLGIRPQYVEPGSRTARAAARAEAGGDERAAQVLGRLADVPQGIWLTPEEHPPGDVGGFVGAVVAAADEADRVPVLVVYGVPDRDCTGGFSSGGLTAADYPAWVQEVATALEPAEVAVAVVEPDAVASALECDGRAERLRLVGEAVRLLRDAGVTTYVDGGHSRWVPPEELAPLLREVGVASVRGFATNVSNYQSDADERAYAERLSELLGGARYVIDRGRNGAPASEEWCNPPDRVLGREPGYVDDGTAQDAFLWVKPPAESDGTCHGGPPAGGLWVERALEMADRSGW